MFLINSRLDLFTVTGRGSKSVSYHPNRHPFSRSYGAILPSSLTIVLPIALVCSTHLPVSVLVRAPTDFLEVFLGSMGSLTSLNCFVQHLSHMRSAFHYFSAYVSSRGRPEPRRATLLRHPIGIAPIWRDRNIYLLCIDYAFRPRLSSRLTLGGLALPRNP